MREPFGIESTLGGDGMAKAYSANMRERVIGRVESGASRPEAAEHYEVSPSTAAMWVMCFTIDGAMTGERFLAYVERRLAPTLKRNEIVTIDNFPAHKAASILGNRSARRDTSLSAQIFA